MDGNLSISAAQLLTIVGAIVAAVVSALTAVFWQLLKSKDQAYEDMKKELEARVAAKDSYYRDLKIEMDARVLGIYNDREAFKAMLRQSMNVNSDFAEVIKSWGIELPQELKQKIKDMRAGKVRPKEEDRP